MIGEVNVNDPDKYKEYLLEVPKISAKYGAKYLVRGGNVTIHEGVWNPKRIVVIEFPNRDMAMRFYDGAEYAPWKKIREEYADSKIIFVDGV
tara:strand:+ start:186 stop:461 length:276 start_codon:yes stop_codon:yes gene_type:complete